MASGTDCADGVPQKRFGDLFPLPLCGVPAKPVGGSRSSIRRWHRARLIALDSRETARGLNFLAGFRDDSQFPSMEVCAAQRSSLNLIHKLQSTRQWPKDSMVAPRAALSKLLREDVGYATSVGALEAYRRGCVSIPQDADVQPLLSTLLPDKERSQLENFSAELLLPPETRGALYDDVSTFSRCFHDPSFRDPLVWAGFVFELHRSSLIHFTMSPRVQVGIFFVSKKNNRLRMIIDARRTNALFKPPPTTALASIEAFARLDLSPDELTGVSQNFCVSQEDVKDFFYRLKISPELGDYFSLPPVDLQLLVNEYRKQQLPVPADVSSLALTQGSACPCMTVLPMGFSWAFHLAHMSHEFLAGQAVAESELIRDKQPTPPLPKSRSLLLIYADNASHIAESASVSSASRARLSALLNRIGLAWLHMRSQSPRAAALCSEQLSMVTLVSWAQLRSAPLGWTKHCMAFVKACVSLVQDSGKLLATSLTRCCAEGHCWPRCIMCIASLLRTWTIRCESGTM